MICRILIGNRMPQYLSLQLHVREWLRISYSFFGREMLWKLSQTLSPSRKELCRFAFHGCFYTNTGKTLLHFRSAVRQQVQMQRHYYLFNEIHADRQDGGNRQHDNKLDNEVNIELLLGHDTRRRLSKLMQPKKGCKWLCNTSDISSPQRYYIWALLLV